MTIDIAFIDPPYERDQIYKDALQRLGSTSLLAAEGLVVLEHSKRKEMPETAESLNASET